MTLLPHLPHPKDQRTVLFRCDGTAQTGLGHTSRCLALAEACVDVGCRCSFFGRYDAPAQAMLEASGMHWKVLAAASWGANDLKDLTSLARRTGACGVVVDSYAVDAAYVAQAESDAAHVLLIDDFAALENYECSAVLNFTTRAEDLQYPRSLIRCFLGPRWFLARRGIRHLRKRGARAIRDVHHVLVTSGGNDPFDISLPVVESLLACNSDLCLHVVSPAIRPTRAALEAVLVEFSGETAILTSQLPDLSSELAWADLCISSAGLTKYETAYVGMPSGVLSQNEGQARDTVRFEALGMTVDLGLASQGSCTRLASRIDRLLDDPVLRESLQQHCLATFPLDPTRDLAIALLADVFLNT